MQMQEIRGIDRQAGVEWHGRAIYGELDKNVTNMYNLCELDVTNA
jgi:hypothetical protein